MGDKSKIEWTDDTWNPWHGCIKVSPGCKNCYMYTDKKRYGQDATIITRSKTTFNAPYKLEGPLIFTCSWSDFFIEQADEWRDEAWKIIKETPHLTYQILTKRPENILSRLPSDWGSGYKNCWLGVSCENQETADKRIPLLLQTPAAVRFISCEPLLSEIDLTEFQPFRLAKYGRDTFMAARGILAGDISWVIVGGESGPKARPFYIEWARSIIKQCKDAGVPAFMKQLGENHDWCKSRLFEPDEDYDSDFCDVYESGEGMRCSRHCEFMEDKKGGDVSEWPQDLRIREYPA